MKPYEGILFDADETLFHFDAFRGLQAMFEKFGVLFTKEDFESYQNLNSSLWISYQDGVINASQLQHLRFATWSKKISVSTNELNSGFLAAMADICEPLPGAVRLLEGLHGTTKLGIITNGFVELQEARLNRTGLRKYFDVLVISELVGVSKPHRAIFDHALLCLGSPPPENVLMVGDNPHSDILGGINAGLDTCWLNVDCRSSPDDIGATFQVSNLSELAEILSVARNQVGSSANGHV